MSGARTNALATLRGQIERIETAEVVHHRDRVALGHSEADGALKGGLARAAIHEVFCEGRQGTAATGFVMGLAGRVSARRPLLWVRQDFSEIETGALSMSGLARARPRSAPRGDGARRRRGERAAHLGRCAGLRCAGRRRARALGRDQAVRSRGEPQADACRARLRRHRPDAADGRATFAVDRGDRWMLRAAHSPPGPASMPAAPWSAWGAPRFDAELLRNRHGPCGRWIMEWKCDECQFSEPSAHSQPVAAAPAHRSDPAVLQQRRAG